MAKQTLNTESSLEGGIAVEAALDSDSRPIEAVFIRDDRRDSRIASIQRWARELGVPIERVAAGEFDRRFPGTNHGGVVAKVGPRRLVSLPDLLNGKAEPVIVMLDGVEDPYNFGQAVRALYAAGVDGLVLRPRNWLTAAATVARASAGASERMPTAVVETAEDGAAFFKTHGLLIACATIDDAIPMTEADLTGPLFLVIGGEKRGISRSFLAAADIRISIPYERDFSHSLGTAGATAVLAFEILRQRRMKQ